MYFDIQRERSQPAPDHLYSICPGPKQLRLPTERGWGESKLGVIAEIGKYTACWCRDFFQVNILVNDLRVNRKNGCWAMAFKERLLHKHFYKKGDLNHTHPASQVFANRAMSQDGPRVCYRGIA